MADPADARAAFREAVRAAEARAEAEYTASQETPAAPSDGEPPTAVPVQASEQPLTTEPVVETTDTSAEAQTATPPALEQVETVESLREKLAAAEARLAEKDSFIGRQSGEVGELRDTVQQMQAQLATLAAQPQAAPAPVVPITQDLIDENPALAVQLAYEQKNVPALQAAFDNWKDEDPFAAASWRADKIIEEREAALNERIAQLEGNIQTVQQPQQEAAETAVWNQAFASVQSAHPDFLVVDETTGKSTAERILEDVAPQYPALLAQLQTSDANVKAQVLNALYEIDRASRLDPATLAQALREEAAAADAEEAATRAAAAGVVSQTTAGQPSVEKSYEELERERYLERMGSKPSLRRGWTGR